MNTLFGQVPRWMGTVFLPLLLLVGNPAMAQPDDGSASSDAAQDGQAAADGDVPVTDQPGGIQAASGSDEEQDGDAEEDGDDAVPGRFIPSEQISQDRGVSFPADI